MIDIKSKKFWLTTGAVLAAPAVLNLTLFQFNTPLTYGDGDEWLSFWGNYSGGLISAYVAYFIANSQIKKQAEIDQAKENYTRYTSQLPALVRIQMELKRYITDIKKVLEERSFNMMAIYNSGEIDENEDEETQEMLIKVEADMKKYEMKNFNLNLFDIVERIEDVDLQVKLISCFQFYEDFCSTIITDIEVLEEQKSKIINELNLNADGLDIYYLNDEAKRIENEINRLQTNKIDIWETFYVENILGKFEDVLLKVTEEIENVKKAKNSPPQI
ncbi:hypothetical protein [Priestia megaterium]|uniref:hypothetical protein n=1 Tax=Priestia megaterium TaxID=1404 RepID=UPI0012D91635|nr:hypothetical protein [Priestia megaterium]MUL29485.1 hypothetical protein [Priestia megaterium]